MSILTWLHIVTKREVFDIERRRSRDDNKDYDNDIEDYIDTDDANEPKSIMMDITNYREMYSDDVLAVLDEMKPIHRDALLLQQAGYSLKEIADIEYAKKTLKNYNIDTVKSRLFLARQYLKKHLTRDGERRD
jgi:DNA-directed RNA polymerase specialized sigma24 family protein